MFGVILFTNGTLFGTPCIFTQGMNLQAVWCLGLGFIQKISTRLRFPNYLIFSTRVDMFGVILFTHETLFGTPCMFTEGTNLQAVWCLGLGFIQKISTRLRFPNYLIFSTRVDMFGVILFTHGTLFGTPCMFTQGMHLQAVWCLGFIQKISACLRFPNYLIFSTRAEMFGVILFTHGTLFWDTLYVYSRYEFAGGLVFGFCPKN